MKLTPWFPGTVKPVRVGVYERQYDKETFYCRWDGEYWHAWAMTPKHAEKLPGFSALQNLPWRGVLNDPQPPSLPSPLLCLQPRHARPPGQQPAAGDLEMRGMRKERNPMTTMQIDRAVVEQALEALYATERFAGHGAYPADEVSSAITALRAALAQQAEPELSRCPQCNGPADNGFDRSFPPSPYLCKKCMAEPVGPGAWVASKDGRVIYDDASTDDGLLRVSGDFENDEQRIRYAQRIVDKLNAALVAAAEREACAALLEANGMRCGEESLSRLILETNAAAIRARTP